MEWLNGIFQAIKLPIKFIIGMVLFIAVLFLLPQEILIYFGIFQIFENYRGYFSLVFLGGIVFLLLNIVIYFVNLIKLQIGSNNKIRNQKILNKKINTYILELDSTEKAILREFILGGKNTIELPVTNAAISTLIAKNILHVTGNYQKNTIYGALRPIKINDYVFTILKPKMIDIPYDTISQVTEKDFYKFSEMRPDFIVDLERFRKYLG